MFDHLYFCLKIILDLKKWCVFQRKYSCLKYLSLGEFANDGDTCEINYLYILYLKEGYKALGSNQATLSCNASCHWILWF